MANTHYLGIVAKKNPKHESGYEVAKHVTEADVLLKVELYSGEKTYHPLNLSKTQKELPGQKLVDHINQYHPNLNTLVTGDRTLKDERLKEKGIINKAYKSGSDVYEVIGKYKEKYRAYKKAA